MTVFVCSNKFNKYLEKWKDVARKNVFANFVLINDDPEHIFSNEEDVDLANVVLLNNRKSFGKVKSIISYILDNSINDWTVVFDDKDILLNENMSNLYLMLNNCETNYILVSDCLSEKRKIIGNVYIDNKTLKEFYINDGKIGDKTIIFHSNKIIDNKKLYEVFLSYTCYIYETSLFFCYFDIKALRIEPLIIHKYNNDGITSNNLKNKIENYQYYLWETEFYLNNKPSFNILISRLFILWYLRKKGRINLKPAYKFLYIFLKTFWLFSIIQKIYLWKLKKVAEIN